MKKVVIDFTGLYNPDTNNVDYLYSINESLHSNDFTVIKLNSIKINSFTVENRVNEYFKNIKSNLKNKSVENNHSDLRSLFFLIDHRDLAYEIKNEILLIEKLKIIIAKHSNCLLTLIISKNQNHLVEYFKKQN